MSTAVAKILDKLKRCGCLTAMDIANILAVSPATVSEWNTSSALPHPKTQLILSDLCYVVERLAEFYSPEEARLWLHAGHRLLGGFRAVDLIGEDRADKVLAVIESLNESALT